MLLHSDIIATCSEYTLELLLWLLGAFILGYLLRWFLGAATRDRVAELEKDIAAWKVKCNDFEADLGTARYEKDKIAEELVACKKVRGDLELKLRACMEQVENAKANASNIVAAAPIMSNPQNLVSDTGNAPTGYPAFLKEDNLQIVEGIGPKIEGILNKDGISTWSKLSNTTASYLSTLLEAAGSRYRVHDPKTWPEQARLATEGKWDELIKYQNFLGGGKDNQNVNSDSSKVEKLYLKAIGLKSFNADDLKVVEGIGPKIEELLKNAGINSHAELAESTPEKIKEILNEAGERYRLADPSTWPKQAKMATDGKWEELKFYQDFLQGGKE